MAIFFHSHSTAPLFYGLNRTRKKTEEEEEILDWIKENKKKNSNGG